MKWNIETKILFPFVFLFFISLSVVLMISFKNDYDFIVENQFRNMDNRIEELTANLNFKITEKRQAALSEQDILNEIKATKIKRLVIVKDQEVLLNQTSLAVDLHKIHGDKTSAQIDHLMADDYLISYQYYQPFNWTLVLVEDRKQLLAFFYEAYKYNVLTGIIFLTISLQVTIMLASNMTKPVQKLVAFCALVSDGEYEKRIAFNRKDEIGKLGLAFNQMLDQLNTSMSELIRVKNYNQDILNSIEKGIITFDAQEKKISENPFAHRVIHESETYFCEGKTIMETVEAMVFLTHVTKESQYQQFQFVRDDGDWKYMDLYTSIMRGNENQVNGYICSFHDITERKKMEGRMQRLDRLATAGRLAAGVAHEIRNPLAGMRASIQVLNKRLKNDLSGRNETMFLRLIKEIDRINKLISDLLDYSKRKDYRPERVSVNQRIRDTLELLDKVLKDKQIEVHLEFEEPALHFYVDPSHFAQMTLNLIKNAAEAVGQQGGMITIKGRVLDASEKWAELTIIDNGSGIPIEMQEKVYEPFVTTKPEGTGLGLATVFELVSENNGEIDIISKADEGTEIRLRFKTGGIQNDETCNGD